VALTGFFFPRLPIMPRHPVSDLLLHNFPENGVKFLLYNPDNLRDVIAYLQTKVPVHIYVSASVPCRSTDAPLHLQAL